MAIMANSQSCTRVSQCKQRGLESSLNTHHRASPCATKQNALRRTAGLRAAQVHQRKVHRATRLVTTSSFDFNKLPFNPFEPLSFIKPPVIKEPVALSEGYEVEGSWVLKPVGRRTGVIHLMGTFHLELEYHPLDLARDRKAPVKS
eukprot:3211852-Pyramimonas_sp.AAC.3